MYFLIFPPEDILNLCLNFKESLSIYAYQLYAYKKRVLHEVSKKVI